MNWKKIHALADALTPKMKAAIVRAFARAAGQNPLSVIMRVVETQGLTPRQIALLTQNLPALVEHATHPHILKAARGAAKIEIHSLAGAGVTLDFARVNPYVITTARSQAAILVTRVSLETQAAIRAVVVEGFKQGITRRNLSRLIKPMIGLTERQALAALHFSERMKMAGAPLPMVNRETTAYVHRMIRERAETIARTELIGASVRGQRAAWLAGRRDGVIPAGAEMEWIVTPDDRLCKRCLDMEGETADVEGTFKGGSIGPPLHPRCRCAVGLTASSLKPRRRKK